MDLRLKLSPLEVFANVNSRAIESQYKSISNEFIYFFEYGLPFDSSAAAPSDYAFPIQVCIEYARGNRLYSRIVTEKVLYAIALPPISFCNYNIITMYAKKLGQKIIALKEDEEDKRKPLANKLQTLVTDYMENKKINFPLNHSKEGSKRDVCSKFLNGLMKSTRKGKKKDKVAEKVNMHQTQLINHYKKK